MTAPSTMTVCLPFQLKVCLFHYALNLLLIYFLDVPIETRNAEEALEIVVESVAENENKNAADQQNEPPIGKFPY